LEYNRKPFQEANWKDFIEHLNARFMAVHCSWKQVHDKWSKMKDKYEIKKKKTQVTSASPFDWPWFERFDQMFGGIAKINGIPNAFDQGVQNLHSHSEVQTFEVSDEDVTQGIQEHSNPPQQVLVFSHGNEEEVHAPLVGSNTLRTRTCKLPNVQGKANKRMESKRRKLDAGSFAIADAIEEFSKGVKEIEKMKMQETKRITTQLFQNEQIGRKLVV
jgi:hypothetical protein